ncbi:MAG TPA: hypothetical protein PLN94_06400 [Thiolinea sp.]|nr:hypothetical protein [Thiolinea sp.]
MGFELEALEQLGSVTLLHGSLSGIGNRGSKVQEKGHFWHGTLLPQPLPWR